LRKAQPIRRCVAKSAGIQEKGIAALYNQLVDVDPVTALKIHMNDVKRVTRALEIYG
jgi:tRNA dimethylallyltransferase